MIYVGENKSTICKGDFHPAMLYKGDKKIAGYVTKEFSGEGGITLENCYNDKLHNAVIYGNSIQDGTPTPETPVEVQSVGEKVTEGEYAGKYRVSVTAKGEDSSTQMQAFDIYLDEPLRKVGDYADCVDFGKSVVVRNVGMRYLKDYTASSWVLTTPLDSLEHYILCLRDDSIRPNYSDDKLTNSEKTAISKCFSNLFKIVDTPNYNALGMKDTIALHEWAMNIRVCIAKTRLTDASVDAFVSWLNENNPYMIRILVEPTEEAIELPKLPTFKGTTVYEIDTSVAATISGKYKSTEE